MLMRGRLLVFGIFFLFLVMSNVCVLQLQEFDHGSATHVRCMFSTPHGDAAKYPLTTRPCTCSYTPPYVYFRNHNRVQRSSSQLPLEKTAVRMA